MMGQSRPGAGGGLVWARAATLLYRLDVDAAANPLTLIGTIGVAKRSPESPCSSRTNPRYWA